MKKIGFLGCGKIGQALLHHCRQQKDSRPSFIQDPVFSEEQAPCPVIRKADQRLYDETDLVIECATASVLKENIAMILAASDLLVFSVTAFSDEAFAKVVADLCARYDRRVYIPHGAIIGLDGLYDARSLLTSVQITTTKSPKSLGLTGTERMVVYEGPTRGACQEFPRNVNVHATVALAGLGFEKTRSCIVADPAVTTNEHIIEAIGEGIHFRILVESTAGAGVTGAFTPVSACASLERILAGKTAFFFC